MGGEQLAEQNSQDFSKVDAILAVKGNEFHTVFGESVENALNLNTWRVGEDLAAMYQALEREVAAAVEQGGRIRERIRTDLFPLVFKHPQAPKHAGCYNVSVEMIERVHRGLLFT